MLRTLCTQESCAACCLLHRRLLLQLACRTGFRDCRIALHHLRSPDKHTRRAALVMALSLAVQWIFGPLQPHDKCINQYSQSRARILAPHEGTLSLCSASSVRCCNGSSTRWRQ